MENALSVIKLLGSGITFVLTYLFGGADVALVILIALITIDYITGITAACVEKKLSSEVGFNGIAKKVGTLLIVAVANLIGVYVGFEVRGIVIGYYIANEGISVLENTSRIGVPYPQKLLEVLQQLKKGGSDENK